MLFSLVEDFLEDTMMKMMILFVCVFEMRFYNVGFILHLAFYQLYRG